MMGASRAYPLAVIRGDAGPASARARSAEPRHNMPGRGVAIGLAIMLPIYALIGLVFALLE